MPTAALTKHVVEKLIPRDTYYIMWDESLPKFGVQVLRSGIRTYVVQYRPLGQGIDRRMKLGRHGDLTPEEARKLAKKVLAEVAGGANPAVERKEDRGAPTVATLAPLYAERQAKRGKAATAEWTARLFKTYILPAFGSRRVADITTADVSRLHHKLSDKPVQANRVRAVLSGFFSFAEAEGHRPPYSNPCKLVKPYAEQSKEHFLAPDELARLGTALRLAETDGLPPTIAERANAAKRGKTMADTLPVDAETVAVLRLLLFTGCRKGEVLSLRWSEVDLVRGVLNLGDTKTGKSLRPLNAPACEILSARRQLNGSPFVFPSDDLQQPRADITKVWFRVREAAGLNHVRIHDFRHTVATTALSGGASWPLIGGLLGHKHASTTQKYAHLSRDPLSRVAETVGADLAAALNGTDTPVTQLHRRPA